MMGTIKAGMTRAWALMQGQVERKSKRKQRRYLVTEHGVRVHMRGCPPAGVREALAPMIAVAQTGDGKSPESKEAITRLRRDFGLVAQIERGFLAVAIERSRYDVPRLHRIRAKGEFGTSRVKRHRRQLAAAQAFQVAA